MKNSSNVVDDPNDENNFPHKFLLTNTQVSRLRKAFVNNSSVNIKLSETQLHKIGQSGKSIKLLTKSVLIQLGLTAASSETNAAIHKKYFDQVLQY